MQKNEYRRVQIMLRGVAPGLSGHVRLERRTLMGSMQFTIYGAQNDVALEAALIGKRGGIAQCSRVGLINRDSRGQSGMMYQFDPRDISGLELEEYDMVAVLDVSDGQPSVALFGHLNGSKEIDWGAVNGAVTMAYGAGAGAVQAEAPVTELPEAAEVFSAQPIEFTEPVDEAAAPQADEAPEAAPAQDVIIETLDAGVEWPELIEPIRALFSSSVVEPPFDTKGYVFVRAPMPTESGIGYCAIGVRPVAGIPGSVCYAIPGTFSVEPPPGLEGYVWRGGSQSGYWVVWQDVNTGEPIDPE